MSKTETLTDYKGTIHLLALNQGEHTLCNITFEVDIEDGNPLMKFTGDIKITCPDCVKQIKACRKCKIKETNDELEKVMKTK